MTSSPSPSQGKKEWLYAGEMEPLITDCCGENMYDDEGNLRCRGCKEIIGKLKDLIDLHNMTNDS